MCCWRPCDHTSRSLRACYLTSSCLFFLRWCFVRCCLDIRKTPHESEKGTCISHFTFMVSPIALIFSNAWTSSYFKLLRSSFIVYLFLAVKKKNRYIEHQAGTYLNTVYSIVVFGIVLFDACVLILYAHLINRTELEFSPALVYPLTPTMTSSLLIDIIVDLTHLYIQFIFTQIFICGVFGSFFLLFRFRFLLYYEYNRLHWSIKSFNRKHLWFCNLDWKGKIERFEISFDAIWCKERKSVVTFLSIGQSFTRKELMQFERW